MLGRNVNVFLGASAPLMAFSRNDRVLDIGCGPGHLIAELAPNVGEICGLDTSPKYIRACRERFADFPNVSIGQLGDDYTNLSAAGDGKFHKIVCLSVIQYYRDKNDVRKLLAAVKNVAASQARFLIADILIETTLARDILSLVQVGGAVMASWSMYSSFYGGRDSVSTRGCVGMSDCSASAKANCGGWRLKENVEAEVINKRLTVNR